MARVNWRLAWCYRGGERKRLSRWQVANRLARTRFSMNTIALLVADASTAQFAEP